jgi:hypothetical protein
MATTTNYSWTTPDDTDLVKDGASAIRSLGTAIDSTVFTNAGNAVQKSTIDAKGDLLVGTADNTVGRLAVGTNNYVLTADSNETSGMKWAAAAAGGGKVLQVVSTTYSTQTSVSSDTTWTDSGISLSITPSAATSKVLILASYYYRKNGADADAAVDIRLVRGATTIFTHTRNIATDSTNFHMQQNGMTYLDSPSTTSATTYKIQFKGHTATTVSMQYLSNPSSLILMEIGA